jgi:hypothetical protein
MGQFALSDGEFTPCNTEIINREYKQRARLRRASARENFYDFENFVFGF